MSTIIYLQTIDIQITLPYYNPKIRHCNLSQVRSSVGIDEDENITINVAICAEEDKSEINFRNPHN